MIGCEVVFLWESCFFEIVYPLCVTVIVFPKNYHSTNDDRMLASKLKEKKLGHTMCMYAIAYVL